MNSVPSQSCSSSTSGWVAATLVIGSALMVKHLELSGGLLLAASLLPVPALVWMFTMQARWIRALDELQQRSQIVAMAIAFAGTGLAVLT